VSEHSNTAGLFVVLLTFATAAAAYWSGWNPFLWGILGFLGWTALFSALLVVAAMDPARPQDP
jgi:hypothetical protein